MSRNREVQVRLYELTNGLESRGGVAFKFGEWKNPATGSIGVPASRLLVLLEGVVDREGPLSIT